MKIKQQLSLFTISSVAVAVIVTATLSILLILRQGRATLDEYREEEMQRIRTNIQEYVEMAYQSVESTYMQIEDNAYLEKFYGNRLQSIMDIAVAAIHKRVRMMEQGKLTLKEAQELAIQDIEAMRFDNNTGYIWVNDTTMPYQTMIMHPTIPSLNGTLLTDPKFNCAMGRNQNLFQAATEVATQNGSGFIDYIWPKPTPSGVSEPVKKLSFVYYYKEWGWVMGTGIYLDDAKNDIVKRILDNLNTMQYNDGQGYFWVTDMTLPYPTMVMHPTVPSLNGQVLDDPSFDCVKETDQNLFQRMAEIARQDTTGFVEYVWPNPLTKDREPKLSYVKRFDPMNWTIGTGAFINHIEERIKVKENEINAHVRNVIIITIIVSLVLIGLGYLSIRYMANSISNAIERVKNSLEKLSRGKSIDKLYTKGDDEISAMNASLNDLVDGMNAYATFAGEIGTGNLDAKFIALSEEDTLGNSLIQMRDNLKKIREEEQQRKWHAEGIALFNDIIRKHNEDFRELCHYLVINVAQYMDVNQCALYLVESAQEETYLELYACYAYDRHRHRTKRIGIHEGMIGQAVLEKDYIYMEDVPDNYVTITSGLGLSKPTVIMIYPLVHNEEVQGVLEMASFKKLKPHEISFLGKLTQDIAATVAASRTSEETRKLLEETRQMSEEMRAQEEELRQNNEELMATQEEMRRKLSEMERNEGVAG